MMEIRLKLTFLENLFLCLCLLTGLGQANGSADVTVTEGSEADLPCFIRPEQNIEQDAFVWEKYRQMVFLYKNGNHSNNGLPDQDEQFKGRVSHFPDQLQFGDASIRIRDTKESDSGTYRCDFSPDELKRQIFYIKLVVDPEPPEGFPTGPVVGGVVPAVLLLIVVGVILYKCYKRGETSKLSVRTFKTKDGMLLQCVVRGASPKPKVEWQDSSGNILPPEELHVIEGGGKYFIILETTVTKTGNYRCVVTQEGINHQVSEEISVKIPVFTGAEPSQDEASKLTAMIHKTDDWAQLWCEVRGASPKPKVEWQDSSGNILPDEEPYVREGGGKYFIILETIVTKTGNYRCVVTQEGIEDQIDAEIFVFIPGAWGGFKRRFCWLWCSLCNCCKKDSQTERKGEENSPESVELNRNHDTSGV